MPRKLDDPTVRSVNELRQEGEDAFAEAVKDALPRLRPLLLAIEAAGEQTQTEIRRLVADFDGSPRSQCKLAGLLSARFPGEPLGDWHELPVDELLGYIDAAVSINSRPEGIPHDKRTKPMSKAEALKYIGWPAHAETEREARDWLSRSIRDGEYRWEEINNKSGVYHLDDFKTECWDEIRAH